MSRFIDAIPKGIKDGIFLKCRKELGDLIKTELGIADTNNRGEFYDHLLEVDLITRGGFSWKTMGRESGWGNDVDRPRLQRR